MRKSARRGGLLGVCVLLFVFWMWADGRKGREGKGCVVDGGGDGNFPKNKNNRRRCCLALVLFGNEQHRCPESLTPITNSTGAHAEKKGRVVRGGFL